MYVDNLKYYCNFMIRYYQAMIDQLFDYYLKHQEDLVTKYNGKYLVITIDGLQGVYDTQEEGYSSAIKTFGQGNFILQLCTAGKDAYTEKFFTSRVVFK